MNDLDTLAAQIRGKIIQMSHHSGAPHLASALSTVEILVSAYWKVLNINPDTVNRPDRDRFIFSKGHAASALYAVLSFKDIIPDEDIEKFAEPGARLAEQPGWC